MRTYRQAQHSDLEYLVQIRINAMKESLEAAGRFDQKRARQRLVDSFIPSNTFICMEDKSFLAFYSYTVHNEVIKLVHLYVDPQYQKRGIGKEIINQIKTISKTQGKSIVLETLKMSPANAFYKHYGFTKTGETEFDNTYQWNPEN